VADIQGLIFDIGGDMLAHGAGLADQLALELGFTVDPIAVRGSDATPARVNLCRREKGCNLVHCYTGITESVDVAGK